MAAPHVVAVAPSYQFQRIDEVKGKKDVMWSVSLRLSLTSTLFTSDDLEVVFVQVLEPIEELVFRTGEPSASKKPVPNEFKHAKHIGHLKQPIALRMDVTDKQDLGRENGKSLREKIFYLPLTIVIIDLDAVIAVKHVRIVDQEPYDVLQQKIMDCGIGRNEFFVKGKALVEVWCPPDKSHHPCHDAPPVVTVHVGISKFTANERSCVYAMLPL